MSIASYKKGPGKQASSHAPTVPVLLLSLIQGQANSTRGAGVQYSSCRGGGGDRDPVWPPGGVGMIRINKVG